MRRMADDESEWPAMFHPERELLVRREQLYRIERVSAFGDNAFVELASQDSVSLLEFSPQGQRFIGDKRQAHFIAAADFKWAKFRGPVEAGVQLLSPLNERTERDAVKDDERALAEAVASLQCFAVQPLEWRPLQLCQRRPKFRGYAQSFTLSIEHGAAFHVHERT